MTAVCRSCGGGVVWARTEKGKLAPIDAEPTEVGTIILRYPERDGEGEPLAIFGVPDDAYPEAARFTSHFATCPQADEWRRRRQEASA